MARRPTPPIIYALSSVVFAAFLLLCFVLQSPLQNVLRIPTKIWDEPGRDDAAPGGDYLLGVGKADITGYESKPILFEQRLIDPAPSLKSI